MTVSPIQALLIDRSAALLMAAKERQGMHTHFCCVHPAIIGAPGRDWVVLTKREFLELAQPPVMVEPQVMQ